MLWFGSWQEKKKKCKIDLVMTRKLRNKKGRISTLDIGFLVVALRFQIQIPIYLVFVENTRNRYKRGFISS